MANDKAIEYSSILSKVNKTIERMQNIGLNITKYSEILKGIETELANSIENNTNEIFNDNMQTDILNIAYSNAINKLELLLKDMDKYEIYLQTAGFCGTLRMFIANEKNKEYNNDYNKLRQMRTKLLELLEGIKKSETLNYQVEGPLVEDIYNLAYEFIKVEIKETGTSQVLGIMQTNEIDKNHIERAILNELEHLNLNEEQYRELVSKKYEIDTLGFAASYVDVDFITLIINCTTDSKINQKKLQELALKLDEYYNKAVEMNKKVTEKTTEFDIAKAGNERNIQKNLLGIIKNIIMTLTSAGVIVSLGVGAVKLTKFGATTTKNKVTTTTYSTISKPTTEEEYRKPNEIKIGRTLYEYAPYEEQEKNFTREVKSYNLTDLETLSFEEYLNLNLGELGIKSKIDTEKKDQLSLKDLYKEAYYILTEVSIDEEDKTSEISKPAMVGIGFCCLILGFLIDFLIEVGMNKFIFREHNEYWGFIDGLKNIISRFKMINDGNKDVKIKKKELEVLFSEARELLLENKDIIDKIVELLDYSSDDNEKLKITKKLERIRTINSKYPNN